MRARLLITACVAALAALGPATAFAHYERPTHFPDGMGHVPAYRTSGPHLVVCKADESDFDRRIATFPATLQEANRALYQECRQSGYHDLQAAVDDVKQPGVTIFVLPGVYLEEPSLLPESEACNHLPAQRVKAGYQILTYEQQKACPHQQNLVGIFGLKDLQIVGTGAMPADVVFDAQFQKLNVIRGDRTSGLYLRNFTAQRSTFNSVYVLEADGFVINQVDGRWNDEYGFLTFASDHGLITNCEAYGNGDSGIYPGGTSDINRGRGFDVPRYAIEVTACHSHDNLLGYSGTGGDSVWVHDNEFDHNTSGASMDSLFPNHPGLPQNHALFERNLIHSNNSNYYGQVRDGTCARPHLERGAERGVVCPAVGVPVGIGVLVIGGNYNVFRDNWIYDNWKLGVAQTWAPGLARNDFSWSAQEDTSHFNRYAGNHMGLDPQGTSAPNGIDFFWDGQGTGSCWQTAGDADPITAPRCPSAAPGRLLGDPNKLVMFGTCSNYDLPTQTIPVGCDWYTTPARPGVFAPSVMVESVAPAIQLLVLLGVFGLVIRRRERRVFSSLTFAAAALGGAILLAGSVEQLYFLAPPGIALLGLAWLGAARLASSRSLAGLCLGLGVLALLEAVDSVVYMLPVPIAPVWLRILFEIVWAVWATAWLARSARRSALEQPVRISRSAAPARR
jgi:hypothetical protein